MAALIADADPSLLEAPVNVLRKSASAGGGVEDRESRAMTRTFARTPGASDRTYGRSAMVALREELKRYPGEFDYDNVVWYAVRRSISHCQSWQSSCFSRQMKRRRWHSGVEM
ncbi:MAG: hypothetical protein CBARDCOR_6421 [uncultured Caballeronia sp.]|nr:MAG: hypothetical protein CBARDCOR_6421 [uncultured Caballeronia sp.]